MNSGTNWNHLDFSLLLFFLLQEQSPDMQYLDLHVYGATLSAELFPCRRVDI
jgi:hypothetical protein